MRSGTPMSPADYRTHSPHISIRSLTILRRLLAAILAAVLLALAVSYGQALTYPGEAPLDVRTVDWIRENGGAPLVNAMNVGSLYSETNTASTRASIISLLRTD